MQEKAKVVKVEGSIVSVVPVDIEACIGCANAECRKNGSLFAAVNRAGFELAPGMEVRVAVPARKQLAQALLAVGVPTLAAWLCWKALDAFAPGLGEAARAGISFAALLAGAVLVYALSRAAPKDLPEIVGIL